jgi:hypothetical protein
VKAIENIMKKNIRMRIVSLSIGSAESTATIKTLRPLTLEIDFRGLATLKVLSADTLKPLVSSGSPGLSF